MLGETESTDDIMYRTYIDSSIYTEVPILYKYSLIIIIIIVIIIILIIIIIIIITIVIIIVAGCTL